MPAAPPWSSSRSRCFSRTRLVVRSRQQSQVTDAVRGQSWDAQGTERTPAAPPPINWPSPPLPDDHQQGAGWKTVDGEARGHSEDEADSDPLDRCDAGGITREQHGSARRRSITQ
jgi:hypothetical protein